MTCKSPHPDFPREGPVPRDNGPGGSLWAVVLAGGEGNRLQAFVRDVLRSARPKQFCRIIGTRSMVRHTWGRAALVVGLDRIVTVITAGQEPYLEEEARDSVPGTVLVQPENKDTAPGLLLPLLWIARRDPRAIVVLFPADHFVWEEDRFAQYVRAAIEASHRIPERLVLLGMEPDGPVTDYGWIAPGEPLPARPGIELYAVRRFWEKPDRQTAVRLFACGYLWNSLIVAGRLGAYLGLAAACVPQVTWLLRVVVGSRVDPPQVRALQHAYRLIPPTNFSRAFLTRHPEGLTVLPARGVCWSDWGDPDRIIATLRRFNRRPAWLPDYARGQPRPDCRRR